jgi:hypothetical protein
VIQFVEVVEDQSLKVEVLKNLGTSSCFEEKAFP